MKFIFYSLCEQVKKVKHIFWMFKENTYILLNYLTLISPSISLGESQSHFFQCFQFTRDYKPELKSPILKQNFIIGLFIICYKLTFQFVVMTQMRKKFQCDFSDSILLRIKAIDSLYDQWYPHVQEQKHLYSNSITYVRAVVEQVVYNK